MRDKTQEGEKERSQRRNRTSAAIMAKSRMRDKNMEMMGQRGTEGDKEWKGKYDES